MTIAVPQLIFMSFLLNYTYPFLLPKPPLMDLGGLIETPRTQKIGVGRFNFFISVINVNLQFCFVGIQ